MYIIHFILYTVYYTLYIILYTVYYTLYIIHGILYTVYYSLYIIHFIVYTVHYTLYIIHCILYTLYYTLYIIHFILYTVYYIALFPFQILSWFASSQMWPMSIKSIIFCSSTDCINFLWILCKMYMKIPNKKSSIIQFISLRFRLLGHLIQWSLGHCRIIV